MISISGIIQWIVIFVVAYLALRVMQKLAEFIGYTISAIISFLSAIALLYLLAKIYVYIGHSYIPLHFDGSHWISKFIPNDYDGILQRIMSLLDNLIHSIK